MNLLVAVVELVETPPNFEVKASLLLRSLASLSGSFRQAQRPENTRNLFKQCKKNSYIEVEQL